MDRPGIRRLMGLDLPRPHAIESELEDEMRLHLDLRVEQLMRRGWTHDEALREARNRYGGIEDARHDNRQHAHRMGRRMRFGRWMEALRQDAQFAVRGLLRQKGWTTVAILTLALGIGANTAVFSVINDLIIDPLRYPAADRLVLVTRVNEKSGFQVSPTRELREAWGAARSLEAVHGFSADTRTLTTNAEPRAVRVNLVEPSFLSFAGARILAGRGFLPDEAEAGAAPVAILAESEWRTRYGANPEAVGGTLTLDGRTYTIVGVVADGLRLPSFYEERAFAWLPLTPDVPHLAGPVVGRLAPGVSAHAAEQELQVLADGVYEGHSISESQFKVTLRRPGSRGQVRQSLLLLAGAVGLLLLIACANVAHLLLARGAARQRELAIRSALGAGGRRILSQLLTESLLLSAVGFLAAVLVGTTGLRLLVAFRPERLPELVHADVDGRVLAITAVMSVLTGIIFGTVAGVHGLRRSGFGVLREAGSTTGDRGRHRARALLVVTEMALSAVLVVGASLLVRTVINLQRVDTGFDPANLYAMSFVLPTSRYPDDAARDDFARRMLDRAGRLPGVAEATVAWQVPPHVAIIIGAWLAEGSDAVSVDGGFTSMNRVRPDYFAVMKTPIVAGRTFDAGAEARNEVIISEGMARLLWPDASPVGRRFRNSQGSDDSWYTVVGVATNTAMRSLREDRATPAIYFPTETGTGFDGASLIVRTRPGVIPVADLRAVSLELDPALPPPTVDRVTDLMVRTVSMQRFLTTLLSLFAGLAVALSAIGLYGVIAYSVRQRVREIGIRVALGAARRDIVRLVVRQGVGLTALGLVLGCLVAMAGSRLIRAMLFGVSSLDLASFAAAGAVLLGIAVIACLAPTARALSVDPVQALRAD